MESDALGTASDFADSTLGASGGVLRTSPMASLAPGRNSMVTRCWMRTKTRRPAGSVVRYSVVRHSGPALGTETSAICETVAGRSDAFCSGLAGGAAAGTETSFGFLRRLSKKACVLHSSLQYLACDRRASGTGLRQRAQIRTDSAYHASRFRFGSCAGMNRNSAPWMVAAASRQVAGPSVNLRVRSCPCAVWSGRNSVAEQSHGQRCM